MIQNKLFTKLLLVAAMLGVWSVSAWADNETLTGSDSPTKDTDFAKTSFTVPGKYWPDKSNRNINSKACLKVRWNQAVASTGNEEGFALKVNNGYKITGLTAQMSGNGNSLTLSDIKIDGVAYSGSYTKEIPANDSYVTITLTDIVATDYINFVKGSGDATQGYVDITVTYEELPTGKKVFVGTPGVADAYGVINSVSPDAFEYESVPSAWASQTGGAFSLGNKTYVANVDPGSTPESQPTYVNGKTLAMTVSGTSWEYHYGRYTLDEAVSSGKLFFRADMYCANSPTFIRFLDDTGAELLRLGFSNGSGDRYYQYAVNGAAASNCDMHTTYRSYHGFSIENLVIDMATGAVSFSLDYINTNNSNKREQVANTKNINIGTGKNIKYLELGSVVNGSQTVHFDNISFYKIAPVYDYTINYTSGGSIIKTITGRNFVGETVNAAESVMVSDIIYSPTALATTSMVLTTSADNNVLNVEVEASVPYTINYVYNEETVSSENGYAIVGNNVDASITTSLWNEGGTTKYYVSDGATTTFAVAASGNTFTVDLRLANTSAVATINAVCGATTHKTFTVTGIEGEEVTVYYPKVVQSTVDSKFYTVSTSDYSKALTYGASINVEYTLDETGIIFFSELEGATYEHESATASGGSVRAFNGTTNVSTNLDNGEYQILVKVTGSRHSKSGSWRGFSMSLGGKEFASYVGQSAIEHSFSLIVPKDNQALKFYKGYNESDWIDYIIIRRIADLPATEKIVVTDAGMATYVSNYNLNFSSATTKAYKIQVTGKGVATLTKVDEVPAKTPVLLICDGGNGEGENIAVTTDAVSAVTDNDLVAGTGAAVATTDGEYTNMILNNGTKGIGFYLANDQTVAADRAYLHIATSLAPVSSGAPMMMVFADEMQTTGVNDVRSKMADVRGDFFDLQGRKVANPTKGLYIVNGKKAIVK